MKKAALFAGAAIAIVFGSCSDSKFEGYTKAENGLHYKFFNHNEDGAKVQLGDGIIISYVISKEKNDSVIVDSKSVSQDGTGSVTFTMRKSSFAGSFEDGMMMMAKGDSAAFIVSADSFFLKTNGQNELPKGFSPGESLKGVFKIREIRTAKELAENQKKQEAEQAAMMKEMQGREKADFDKYLADNKITAKPTESGLYVIESKKGSGPKPKAGDQVEVNYTGRLLDGTIFDTSNEADAKAGNVYNPQRPYSPIKFVLGRGEVIRGWDEGIAMLSKGGKAKFILPSNLGYGERGGGPIPPYAPLVFEVELISFGPAPEQPAAEGHSANDGHGH